MWQTKEFNQVAGILVILVAAYYALGAYENYLNIKEMKQGNKNGQ